VPFDEVFRTLNRTGFYGPMTVEMWTQFAADPLDAACQARAFVQDLLDKHYLPGERQ
jgi:L-ribulose-5-phosphate 3-epimerase UlaE